jgi:hypothetical protein
LQYFVVVGKAWRNTPFIKNFSAINSHILFFSYVGYLGRTIAQAVSRWLSTAAARVCARVWSSGICGEQSSAVAGCLRVLRFPLPIFMPPDRPSPQSLGVGAKGQKWSTCRVDPLWTPLPTM